MAAMNRSRPPGPVVPLPTSPTAPLPEVALAATFGASPSEGDSTLSLHAAAARSRQAEPSNLLAAFRMSSLAALFMDTPPWLLEPVREPLAPISSIATDREVAFKLTRPLAQSGLSRTGRQGLRVFPSEREGLDGCSVTVNGLPF